MIWLALAVSCSLAIGMIFKHGERRGLDRAALLTVNYAVGFVVAGLLLGREGGARGITLDGGLLALGLVQGALFIAGFYVFALAIREVGMGLATGVMRLSVALPFFASWLVWGDPVGLGQLAGLALAGAAFFLIARPAAGPGPPDPGSSAGRSGRGHPVLVLVLLFVAGGLVDVVMKAFGEVYAAGHSRALFLLFVFGVAFLLGVAVVVAAGVRTGRWPRRAAYGWGLALGLANYGSADFILRAVAALEGPFVFPANSIAIVMGAALLGVAVWRERLTRANLVGLGCAAVALALLAA